MAERNLQLEDWLDDLCVRFILNLPQDNLTSPERICFQIEEAQWFYEDFIRPLNPNLPSMSLRTFSLRIFAHCPLLSDFTAGGKHLVAFEEFLQYKNRIPVRGAIMLNEAMDSTVLVKGWKKNANWSFPRGKINKDEDDLICAIREVYEETGLDLEAAGLVPPDRNVKALNVIVREQQMRLYVFKNVPMDTYFEPRTRKEISKIDWWRLSDLAIAKRKHQNGESDAIINPKQFYMVFPFLGILQKYINQQRRISSHASTNQNIAMSQDDLFTEDDREETYIQTPTTLQEAGDMLSQLLNVRPSQATSLPPQESSSGSALLALLQSPPVDSAPSQPPPQHLPEHFTNAAPLPVVSRHEAQQYHDHGHHYQPQHHVHPQTNFHNPQMQQHVRQFQHPQTQPAYHVSPHHNQPQHLIHPQPLPPNVQKAVFTGGVVPSPPITQPVSQVPSNWNGRFSHNNPHGAPHSSGPQMPVPSHVRRDNPTQLNNHSMSLLNAFKSGPTAGPTQGTAAPHNQSHLVHRPAQIPPQELPAALTQNHGPQPMHGSVKPPAPPAMHNFAPRQEVNPAHKSALLNMFKSPPAQSANVNGHVATSTALPVSNTPSAVELSAVELTPSSLRKAEMASIKGSKLDSKLPEIDPETARNFRPTSILARPPAGKSDHKDPGAHAQRNVPVPAQSASQQQSLHATHRKPSVPVEPLPDKVFAPQILKRPQQGDTIDVTTMFKSPPPVTVTPKAIPTKDRALSNREQPAQHRENLLSLFGKAPLAPSPNEGVVTSPMMSRTSTLDVVSAVSPLDPSARSRVGSIVSAETMSRRGSGSTLSKANENFLLGYLDAVAGGGQR